MYYNITSVSDPVEWFQLVNTLTNGLFGPAMVGAFFIILFLSLTKSNQGRNEPEKNLTVSLMLAMFLSFFLLAIGMVEVQVVMITTVGFLFSVFLVKKSEGGP
jgi:hypothetical protein